MESSVDKILGPIIFFCSPQCLLGMLIGGSVTVDTVILLFRPVVGCESLQQTNETFVHGHGIGTCVILKSTLGPTISLPSVIINPSAH